MKINITISLDSEIVERLKAESNYSELINKEIKAYYEGVLSNNLKKLKQKQAELKKILKESRKEAKIINQKIEKIETNESKFLRLVKTYPNNVIRIVENSESEMKLWANYQTTKILREIGWKNIKKLYKDLKGGVRK